LHHLSRVLAHHLGKRNITFVHLLIMWVEKGH
jgi:hypothetical protein